MSENKVNNTTENESAELDYKNNFMPKVHKIGRLTMALAMFLSFLPVLYFVFVKGYNVESSIWISGISGIVSVGLGMWLSEPEAYWPVLGSAGTYIAYLSGNVGGMRFPVATMVQKDMKADITTPRGQVVTIVGIAASVVVNLIILLIIVLLGEKILAILPETVLAAFGFVVISMFGAMLIMNLNMRGGAKALPNVLPYMVIGVIMWIICNKVFPNMFGWGMAFAVGCSILFAYFRYKKDLAAAEAEDK